MIEYLLEASQGSGRKGRFRRKPWRDKASVKGLANFPKALRGQERVDSEDRRTSPPEPRRNTCLRVVAESAFPSGLLEAAQVTFATLFSSRKLERSLNFCEETCSWKLASEGAYLFKNHTFLVAALPRWVSLLPVYKSFAIVYPSRTASMIFPGVWQSPIR